MGIPSYFSYIIRNHMRVLTKLSQTPLSFDNLYLDCNSIIYDSIREIQKSGQLRPAVADNYSAISSAVCAKIQHYIDQIRPSNTVFIAFDGVAPFAKMNQQKTRRFRSAYLEYHGIVPKSSFNSCLITPGTEFMQYLTTSVNNHKFLSKSAIIVSASDEPGEGEHKLFQYIRANPSAHIGRNTVVYGLDADLLMLSIFHTFHTNIFVYREAPEFAKSLNADLENGESYLLDIRQLCVSITQEMDCKCPNSLRVFDYAFLCFLLGNDFLPHFPGLNIRTRGIYCILDAYKETCGRDAKTFIVEGSKINWHNFRKVLTWLAKREEGWIRTEYVKRGEIRFSTSYTNDAEKEAVFNNAPLVYRATEHYINPGESHWQTRYYKALFRSSPGIDQICTNYFEGLEWVFRYYTDQCFDWRWKYNYHYPPLLSDLVSANWSSRRYFQKPVFNPFSSKTQLSYVLPPSDFDFGSVRFEWAFCRYFWESHFSSLKDPSRHEMEQLESK
jgi:5'-3' exoribonuclease 1